VDLDGRLCWIDGLVLCISVAKGKIKYVWLPELLGVWVVLYSFKCISVQCIGV